MTNSPFPATTSAAAITWPVSIIGTKRLCPFESVQPAGAGSDSDNGTSIGTSSASATYFEDPYDYDFDIDPKSVTGIRQAAIFIPGRTNSANASKSSSEVAKIDSDMRSSSFAGFRACNKPDSEEDDGSDGDSDTSPNSAGSSFPNRGSPSTRHSGTNSDDSDTLSVIPAPELPFPKGNVLGSLIKKMREELGMEASEDYDFDTLLIIPAPELPFPEGNAIASLVGNMRLNFDPTPTDPN
ncbi:hypothetical protein H4S04_004313 [Coemansia sp. S16]|nr:hypothetical protein H4S04_004313 [Coemansia sp. S16]